VNYTKEEVAAFEAKDLRINKVAVIKSLIESGRNSANEVKENCMMVEQYVKYIYEVPEENGKLEKDTAKEVKWSDAIVQPTENEIKILDAIWSEYEKDCYNGIEMAKYASRHTLCKLIIDIFGKYPTNKNSISKVMKQIKLEQILC